MKAIEFTEDLHNFLANELNKYSRENSMRGEKPIAFAYILGKKDEVVCKAIRTNTAGGCMHMPHIDSTEFAKRVLELVRQDLIPCGVARVGMFPFQNGDRGNSLHDLGWIYDDAFILSFSTAGILIESCAPASWVKRYEYKIRVKNG